MTSSSISSRNLAEVFGLPAHVFAHGEQCEHLSGKEHTQKSKHVVAVVAPLSGVGGLWGPSSIAAGQAATDEINLNEGIDGQKLEVLYLNSDIDGIDRIAQQIDELIKDQAVSAIINVGGDDVRRFLKPAVFGRVPQIETLPCEDFECSPEVFTIGATIRRQLISASHLLSDKLRTRRWAIVGQSRSAPPFSNKMVKAFIKKVGGDLVFEENLPFGIYDPSCLIDNLKAAKPDMVFVSLTGQNAIDFNRAFGHAGLHRSAWRISGLFDENILLASGAENSKAMFAVASYFGSLNSKENAAFRDRYFAMHSPSAPALNSIGQSVYEGLNFYASLVAQRRSHNRIKPIAYPSIRGGLFHSNYVNNDPVYLAQTDGIEFSIIGDPADLAAGVTKHI